MNQNYLSWLKIKCLILLLFLFVYPPYSQTSENYAKTISDYEYGLGNGVGRSLANNCSTALTSIEDVKVSQSSDMPLYDVFNVKLSVIKYYRFIGDRKKGDPEINLSYQTPRKTKEILNGQPWQWSLLVNWTEGNKAMVFKCSDSEDIGFDGFITTDVAYFDKIKQAIELTGRFRADYVNILDYFANDYKSDDELIKSVALNLLLGSSEISKDIRAYILVNLLSESPASKQREGWHVKISIENELGINYPPDAPPQFRKQAFIKLVEIANGENENAMDATVILADIASGNPDELRPYLRAGKSGNIIINLQKFMINVKGNGFSPAPLMKLLSEQ
jgi:hypothetical protein